MKLPSVDVLRDHYPALTSKTANLCRDIMRGRTTPEELADSLPNLAEVMNRKFAPASPRLLCMVAIAGLTQSPVGVQSLPEHIETSWLYWLHTDTSRTLCSIAPTPPSRRSVQRDPWLHSGTRATTIYKMASPGSLIAQYELQLKNRTRSK